MCTVAGMTQQPLIQRQHVIPSGLLQGIQYNKSGSIKGLDMTV